MNAMRWIFAAQGLIIVSSITTAAVIGAQPKPAAQTIPFPDGYRSWQHVKSIVVGPEHSSFASRGGFHHYYANAKAVEGYRTGRFANGSVIVDEGVLTEAGSGPMKGLVIEGDRRTLDVMIKDDGLFRDTGGWGFEHFEGSEAKGQTELDVSRRTRCYECHAKSKDRDHVFSVIRVAKFAAVAPASTGAGMGMNAAPQPAGQAQHTMIAPDALQWKSTAPGISMAVLSGSPESDGGHFVIRLKLAAGTRVPPHWHPGDEHLTVITGTFHMGVGEKFDEAAATAMTAGAYGFMPKEVRHFGWVTGDTIVQLHGVGPFKTFFVGQQSTK